MSSQEAPSSSSPATLPKNRTGVWRQVINWQPRRLPSGRIEYAEAGVTWVLDRDEDDEEARAELEETSSMESWYSDWEPDHYDNSEDELQAMRELGRQQLIELRAADAARRAARARGDLDEDDTGSWESWYEEDRGDNSDGDLVDTDGSDDDGEDDKSEDDHDDRGNGDKNPDDDDDDEEPPGVFHTVNDTDVDIDEIDEPMRRVVLCEEPRSPLSLLVREESEEGGEKVEPGANSPTHQVLTELVNDYSALTPLSQFSTRPHARKLGPSSLCPRTTPEHDPNSRAAGYLMSSCPIDPISKSPQLHLSDVSSPALMLERVSKPGTGLQSSPGASLHIEPAALPSSDSSPRSQELSPIQNIFALSIQSSMHAVASWLPTSALFPASPAVSPMNTAVDNQKAWHIAQKHWETLATTEQRSYDFSHKLIPDTHSLHSSRLACLPAALAAMDLDSDETPGAVRGYPRPEDLNPAILTPKSMAPASSQFQGVGEGAVEAKGIATNDDVDMNFKEKKDLKRDTGMYVQHPNTTLRTRKRRCSTSASADVARKRSERERTEVKRTERDE